MASPDITWVFEVNSYVGGPNREEHKYAPVDADLYLLERELFHDGYIHVKYLRKEWDKWAWPGGYPIFYVAADSEVLCCDCCNHNIDQTGAPDSEAQWTIVAADVNWEDDNLRCCHCDKLIESAYGESDNEGAEPSDGDALASAGHGTDEDYGSAEDTL